VSMNSTVLASAAFSGAVAIAVTLLVERWGGRVGGVLGTIPTTIVPAAAGMAAGASVAGLESSLAMVPMGMIVNGVFLMVFLHLPERLRGGERLVLLQTSVLALGVWAVLGSMMLQVTRVALTFMPAVLLAACATSVLGLLGLAVARRPRPAPAARRRPTAVEIGARGVAAALAIGIAVHLATLGHALVAGLASVFPAIFLTTMVGLWLAQGNAVPRGAAGPMLLGSTSVGLYATVAMWSLSSLGVAVGSVVAWLVAVVGWTIPCSLWINHRAQGPGSSVQVQEHR
jgi:hypothetical protein